MLFFGAEKWYFGMGWRRQNRQPRQCLYAYFGASAEGQKICSQVRRETARARMYTSEHCTFFMSTTMTIRLDDDIKDRLDVLAEATQRSKSFLAAEAIREYVNLNEWQLRETREALREADAGDFASDDDVGALAAKWKVNEG
jgi:predicted transcriptional regulator